MAKKFTMSRKTRNIIIICCIALIVAAAAGFFGYIYVTDTTTLGRNITIYGVDVSGKNADEAKEILVNAFSNRTVTFKENEEDVYTTTLGEMGYSLDENVLNEQLSQLEKSRQSEHKLIAKSQDYELDYQIVKNDDQESSALNSNNFGNKTRVASTDAGISYDENAKKYVLTRDVQGNTIDDDKLKTYVDQTLSDNFKLKLLGGDIQITISSDVYQKPSTVFTEDMQTKVDSLNDQLTKYRNSSVTYTFGNETEVVDASTIESWLTISDTDLQVNQDAVKKYVEDLATKYNTIYVSRTFHTSYGNDVTISDNEYGFQIDQDGELTQLLSDIAGGEAVSREPVYSKSGMQRNGTDDLAGSYIEVSIDNQHLWLYKDGVLVTETDIVSGAPTANRSTYRGAWPIAYKAHPYNMTSEEYGYNLTVQYWMPFVYGQGLHDASWQASFGGNRYKNGAGSHGCINLPTDQAALIYNTIDAGYPIIIY